MSTTNSPALDVERVRAAFPSLAQGTARFDSPGGSQTPEVVAQVFELVGQVSEVAGS